MSDALIKEYFDAWDQHDAVAVQNLFSLEGSYRDPTTEGPLFGEDIAAYVQQLFDVFPDLKLELISITPVSDGSIAVPWMLFGTQYGELGDLEPTGKTVALPGCDFIIVEDDKLLSVTGIFDPDHLSEQLE